MLEHEDTIRLIILAQAGDEHAKTVLFEENTPLVKSIVKRYKSKYIDYDDLFQLGSMGLVKAINNFNADFGVRFSTYAVPMISGEIKRFIRDDGSIKVSRSIKVLGYKISKYIEEYKKLKNTEPQIQEIADEFGIDAEEVAFTLDSQHYPMSLYDSADDEERLRLIDRLSTEDGFDKVLDSVMVSDILDGLDDREKQIILLRYFRDKTQSEIATIIGVSQVQVSRLESKIIDKLKQKLNGE